MQSMQEHERRQHIVYVTRHTEYHCRQRECVGVRDRRTGQWQRRHGALRSLLVGASNGVGSFWDEPQLGERLLFMGKESVLTSRVVDTGRPPRDAVWFYSSYSKAGSIDA